MWAWGEGLKGRADFCVFRFFPLRVPPASLQQPLPHHRPRWEITRTHQCSTSQTIRRDPREPLPREIRNRRHPEPTVDGEKVFGHDFQVCGSRDKGQGERSTQSGSGGRRVVSRIRADGWTSLSARTGLVGELVCQRRVDSEIHGVEGTWWGFAGESGQSCRGFPLSLVALPLTCLPSPPVRLPPRRLLAHLVRRGHGET